MNAGKPSASGAQLRIGTRRSPLALVQSGNVRAALAALHPGLEIEIETIRTSGDRFIDRDLSAIGGKGLFTKEIEEALIAGRIDIAVHSMKDVPTWLPEGLGIFCLLEREDPRDVFISAVASSLGGLGSGATVGTASLRRKAQILNSHPDLVVVPLRGNVHTRIEKIKRGEADATLLALAGLKRLGIAEGAGTVLETDEMLPAVGQGAIGIECRAEDARVRELIAPLNHAPTLARVTAERAALAALDGSCRTPIAALAEFEDAAGGDGAGVLALKVLIAKPDGSALFDTRRRGPAAEAEAMGRDAGEELRKTAGPGFFDD
ncbi:MAG: hydroxymethylbilane synthase [Proteobacteria bacterium]|nr:hydroxymethylbilane synthase [Pseudomonadota bacterium]